MLALTASNRPGEVEALARARYVSLTTFRRDGRGVATPVEFVEIEGSLYFRTLPDSGKVRRIRREPRVLLAACTMRGKVTGHKLAGVASLLTPVETEALLPAFRAKYGFAWALLGKLRRPRTQGVRVNLT